MILSYCFEVVFVAQSFVVFVRSISLDTVHLFAQPSWINTYNLDTLYSFAQLISCINTYNFAGYIVFAYKRNLLYPHSVWIILAHIIHFDTLYNHYPKTPHIQLTYIQYTIMYTCIFYVCIKNILLMHVFLFCLYIYGCICMCRTVGHQECNNFFIYKKSLLTCHLLV